MKKGTYMNMLKQSIRKKAFKDLEKIKLSHSKVRNVKHKMFKMQKYLVPNAYKTTREDCQLIFKLRCRVTELKTNMKENYDTYECDACGLSDESQDHILRCTKLLPMNHENHEIPEYDKLLNGKVMEQITIARIFKQNMSVLEKMKNEKT